jgi:adenosylmethionine-8-amino-7-oxononanoate aminotransferase
MHPLARLDRNYIWHPFTQMRDWMKHEPILLAEGKGAVLRDVHGREYLDANSSIWTNLHGHNHPKINAAIQRQLKKVSHTSALGFANAPASLLAAELVKLGNPPKQKTRVKLQASTIPGKRAGRLSKVFFSDDGSTAMEVALKMAYEFVRRTRSDKQPRFLSLEGAYHGDTVGAVALGHIDMFHKAYAGLLFKTDKVSAPYCYRCPYNRAKPERADAREYRKCNWECLGKLEQKFSARKKTGKPYAAFVFEPLMQGAAGMIPQPEGWLSQATELARAHGALLIADEVMTGFGRTGVVGLPENYASQSAAYRTKRKPALSGLLTDSAGLFACHREAVQPDFLALAKGLTGGYLPMAATLTTEGVYDAFLGEYHEFKTFFHGHSYTANQLGASAALASLEVLTSQVSVRARLGLEHALRDELKVLWKHPCVGDIRQVGLIVGIELVKDWRTREPIDLRERAGIRVCDAMARRGVLTRPIGNVIVLMLPYCTSPQQVRKIVAATDRAIASEL